MLQLLASKGLLGYIDGKIKKPDPQTVTTESEKATPIYSSKPTLDEWTFRDQLARGHVTLNCVDISSLGINTNGTAKEAWDSVQEEWGKSTDMRRSHAHEALNRTEYAEGTDIQDHVKLLRTRKAAVDNLSTKLMSDEAWRGIIIRSIPPTAKWLPVIPSLYSMTTSTDIISTLLAHGMILNRGLSKATTSNTSSTALAARTPNANGCTNPNCKARKRTTHTIENCYWPGGGKEGQFPPNFGQRTKANATTSAPTTSTSTTTNSGQTESFVLSARVPTPGRSGVMIDDPITYPPMALISKGFRDFAKGKIPTFMDSGASDTMFVSKDAFTEYKAVTTRVGDSAKATDGNFEIVGEGNMIQWYDVDGRERKITYTCALHAPTLNANLVSISALDRAGLTITFGGGRGVA